MEVSECELKYLAWKRIEAMVEPLSEVRMSRKEQGYRPLVSLQRL